jgi:hypothetical protein
MVSNILIYVLTGSIGMTLRDDLIANMALDALSYKCLKQKLKLPAGVYIKPR